jgi:hypothetical protein
LTSSTETDENRRHHQDGAPSGVTEIYYQGGTMARYGKKASEKVEKAMHERKKGKLKSGRSGKKVKSRKQAIAIGLSQARRAGAKVPRKKSSTKKK